jgi:hypothetical protein
MVAWPVHGSGLGLAPSPTSRRAGAMHFSRNLTLRTMPSKSSSARRMDLADDLAPLESTVPKVGRPRKRPMNGACLFGPADDPKLLARQPQPPLDMMLTSLQPVPLVEPGRYVSTPCDQYGLNADAGLLVASAATKQLSQNGSDHFSAASPIAACVVPSGYFAFANLAQVKCDERPNGCLNCERLELTCVQHGSDPPLESPTTPRAITGIKRKRTFRVCIPCRQSKIKCTGERPVCSRCRQKSIACAYDADAAEPAWVQQAMPAVTPVSRQHPDTSSASPPRHASSAPSSGPQGDYPATLSW